VILFQTQCLRAFLRLRQNLKPQYYQLCGSYISSWLSRTVSFQQTSVPPVLNESVPLNCQFLQVCMLVYVCVCVYVRVCLCAYVCVCPTARAMKQSQGPITGL